MCQVPAPFGLRRLIRPTSPKAREAGWRDPGDPAGTLFCRPAQWRGLGTESHAAGGCAPARKGKPARRRGRERGLGIRARGASRLGKHPREVRENRLARAGRAPYLGLELAVGGGKRAALRGCARGQEAEGRQQEPAPGTHPPHRGSDARGARGKSQAARTAQPGYPAAAELRTIRAPAMARGARGTGGAGRPPRAWRLLPVQFARPRAGGAGGAGRRRPRGAGP